LPGYKAHLLLVKEGPSINWKTVLQLVLVGLLVKGAWELGRRFGPDIMSWAARRGFIPKREKRVKVEFIDR